ncbi:phosphodiesterase [Treponema parvum]|uniref:Phosphoesterase n=1 Tax=Treponema parvum TaxID=138851 RepID=A0A975IDE3_9SPIR|nr:phosphodiesterase [Treponema parvum]QTQ12702.1 phosphodiesterase [Treponema parvum]
MKYLIFSDIHGSATACEKVIEQFSKMKADHIILLGDILYHGPRNPLPEGHNPGRVAEILNPLANKIICCRGNCDAEVEEMVLKFPVLGTYSLVVDEGVRLFCTHGHVYAPERADGNVAVSGSKTPPISDSAVIFYGHTHIQVLEKNKSGVLVCNPGSVSLPKGGSPAGFAVYENKTVTLYDMEAKILNSLHC